MMPNKRSLNNLGERFLPSIGFILNHAFLNLHDGENLRRPYYSAVRLPTNQALSEKSSNTLDQLDQINNNILKLQCQHFDYDIDLPQSVFCSATTILQSVYFYRPMLVFLSTNVNVSFMTKCHRTKKIQIFILILLCGF